MEVKNSAKEKHINTDQFQTDLKSVHDTVRLGLKTNFFLYFSRIDTRKIFKQQANT